MAADTHAKGIIYFLAGITINNYRIVAQVDSEQIDNAKGSEATYFVPEGAEQNGVLLPRNDGVPIPLPEGPHFFPGELIMLAIRPTGGNGAADVDTTGATSDVYEFSYWFAPVMNPDAGHMEVVQDETDRNTTAGIAPPTDPSLNEGMITPTHAWGPMPPGWGATLVGFARVDLRSAT